MMKLTVLAIVLFVTFSCMNSTEYEPINRVSQSSSEVGNNSDALIGSEDSNTQTSDGSEKVKRDDEEEDAGVSEQASENDDEKMNEDGDMSDMPANDDTPAEDEELEEVDEEPEVEVELISTHYVYVAANDRIIHYELDPNNGALIPKSELMLNNNPENRDNLTMQIAISLDKQFMYVGTAVTNLIQTLSINQDDGTLAILETHNLNFRPVYLHIDSTGKSLLVSSYSNDKVELIPILANGMLSYDSNNPIELLTGDKAHSVLTSPDNDFIIFPNTGVRDTNTSRLQGASFDPVNLTISNIVDLTDLDSAGPRHIRFHPTLSIFYAVNEYADSVSWYTWDEVNNSLTFIDSISTLPQSSDDHTCADLHLTSDGRFLYASNRDNVNTDHSIAMFAVDAATGALSQIPGERVGTVGRPREFAIGPLDQYVFVLGQNVPYRIQSYSINQATGALNSLQTYDLETSPTWVEVLTFTEEVPKVQ